MGVRACLFTGYRGRTDTFDEALDINGDEAVITSKFEPPNLGPLAIALVDAQGVVVSDVVASLGLPWGRHVSYEITFAERGELTQMANALKEEGSAKNEETARMLRDIEAQLISAQSMVGSLKDMFGA